MADDLIEPFRPMVDERVREMHRQGYETLDQRAKAELLELLTTLMQVGAKQDAQTGPLMVMLHRLTTSLAACYAGEARCLEIPLPVGDANHAPGN